MEHAGRRIGMTRPFRPLGTGSASLDGQVNEANERPARCAVTAACRGRTVILPGKDVLCQQERLDNSCDTLYLTRRLQRA
jgi:hypothetical protein